MLNKIILLLFCTAFVFNDLAHAQTDTVGMEGAWAFRLDTNDVGENEQWFDQQLDDKIKLPGTTDEGGFGKRAVKGEVTRLTRSWTYYGPAWYQKDIDIPANWGGKHIELVLERVMWESKIWVDGKYAGMQESLCTPHRFDLSALLKPGRHRITMRIDNRYKYNIGNASGGRMGSPLWTMAVTDESQTTWNGVIGKIKLHMSDAVWIERVEVYPDIDRMQARIVAIIRQLGSEAVSGELTVQATGKDRSVRPVLQPFTTKGKNDPVLEGHDAVKLSQVTGPFYENASQTRVETILSFGDDALKWDEFDPQLYNIKIDLTAKLNGKDCRDVRNVTTGLRKFVADGKKFLLNDRTVFLRGNQDNCVHPLTGYPPMNENQWLRFLQHYKDYGLNHVRFHSWCPPEEAFEAADKLGLLVQVEAPMWDGYGGVGRLADRAAFIRFEAERILNEYGNHPSFCMFSVGNELGNGEEFYLQYLVEVLRERDNRHLYTCASAPASSLRNDDYLVGANGITGDWACSISATCFRGLRQWKGSNAGDVRTEIQTMNKPLIAHEIGQQTSFPDFYSWFNKEKYTGPLQALYIDTFKNQFEKYHPKAFGPLYAQASGALQLLLYKAEIEIMLRTPNLSGFHLNGIADYPGEGVALIGVLDATMDDKGIASPETFRQFCSETVPLVRMKTQFLLNGQPFEAKAEIRHHGPRDIKSARWRWTITDDAGAIVKKGDFIKDEVPTGALTNLADIKTVLPAFKASKQLTFTLSMENSGVTNSWPFWVYTNDKFDLAASSSGILVAHEWSDEVKNVLRNGGKVMLLPSKDDVIKAVDADYFPVFWSKSAEASDKVGAMGIYCNDKHPSMSSFPTHTNADWQWYDLLTQSFAININSLPLFYQPVVHLIDFFKNNNRLAMIMEANVGKGKLLVCTLNLGDANERSITQQQMLKSLITYMQSRKFNPQALLTPDQLNNVFENRN